MENSPVPATTATLIQSAPTHTATPHQPSPSPDTLPKQPRFPKDRCYRYIAAEHSEYSDIAKIVRHGLILAATTPKDTPNRMSSTGPKPTNAEADTTAATTASAFAAAREYTRELQALSESTTCDGARLSGSATGLASLPPYEEARANPVAGSRQITLQSPFRTPPKMARQKSKADRSWEVDDSEDGEDATLDSGSERGTDTPLSDVGSDVGRSSSSSNSMGYLLT